MKELADDIRPIVDGLIRKYGIDAMGFIPPTVKREVQFMKELEKNLRPKVKRISIVKIKTEVTVPQKTLNKLQDRIENARKTIIVIENEKYGNILLIDDAVGSGATLNEVAGQIKARKTAKKVIGLSITGSFKGFDVISEV
jgi:predicted amidophosphoribosyltransferase